MLTGRPAFTGQTDADVLESVLHAEPDVTGLPAETPAPIRRLLRRCLEKDRTRRLDSAAVARFEIDDAIASPAAETVPPARSSRRITRVTIAAIASVALLTALAVWILMRPPLPAPVVSRFAIVAPPAWPLNTKSPDRDIALSPDGRYLVYRTGTANVGGGLMVRAIDQLEGRRLAGIRLAYGALFFSPDSQWIGFFENAAIKKVAIAGGPVFTLGPVTGEARGASWGVDNTIVFATDDASTGLWRVSSDGGEPEVLTRPDATRQETDHLFPSVLPNGRGVLFTIAAAVQTDSTQLAVLDLETGQWKTIVRGGTQAEYVAPLTRARQDSSIGSGQRGHLVYAAAGSLRAIEFDPTRLDVLGDPVTVVENVLVKGTGSANYAVSLPGTLVYVPPGEKEGDTRRSLVWVDRKGGEEPLTNAPPDFYNVLDISPDGTRVAIKIGGDIWIRDLAPEMWRRLTFDPRDDSMPLWTPNGRRIIFGSNRAGAVLNLYSQAADGTGTADRLTTTENAQWSTAVTPDGTAIIGTDRSPKGADSLIQVHLTNAASRPGRDVPTPLDEPVVEALFEGGYWPDISRDGRYLAYESSESGRGEVYVRPFPHVNGGRWQVSTMGGRSVAWARSGRELFYLDASNKLTAVPVETSGPTFVHGRPTRVSETSYVAPNPSRHYDESPDGRLLVIKTAVDADPNATPASMVVVEHWLEELNARGR
jgi:serine/threonine-protein kinase